MKAGQGEPEGKSPKPRAGGNGTMSRRAIQCGSNPASAGLFTLPLRYAAAGTAPTNLGFALMPTDDAGPASA